MVAGALVGMALMQFIVSCTLSMLLRHVKRLAVLGTYFDFDEDISKISAKKSVAWLVYISLNLHVKFSNIKRNG